MTNVGGHWLGLFDLYAIYRMMGRGRVEAALLAWEYRNFVPDHSGSDRLNEIAREQKRVADDAYFRMMMRAKS